MSNSPQTAATMAEANDPVSRVLYTTELLEAILLNLDNKTLLLSQRTSRLFADTIRESPQLQHALFFKQHPSQPANFSTRNPLLNDGLFVEVPGLISMNLQIEQDFCDLYINTAYARRPGSLDSSPDASWRRMYSQSTLRTGPTRLICYPRDVSYKGHALRALELHGPLTLGQIFEEFAATCKRTGQYLEGKLSFKDVECKPWIRI